MTQNEQAYFTRQILAELSNIIRLGNLRKLTLCHDKRRTIETNIKAASLAVTRLHDAEQKLLGR